jgi:hypothetical protein
MHLRRALLLFALVLGLAALVATLAPPPPERRSTPKRPTPTGTPPQAQPRERLGGSSRVDFGRGTKRVEVPAHVIVSVRVPQAGQVELPGLDQVGSAEPGTPARFDLFLGQPGRYEVLFAPARGGAPRRLGTLVARSETD